MTSSSTLERSQLRNAGDESGLLLNSAWPVSHLQKLMTYVQARRYEGPDLFDGLNSRLFRPTPLYASEWFRLAVIQFCKRSPLNFRPLLRVPDGFNAKGGALFLMGYLRLWERFQKETYAEEAHHLYQRLQQTRIPRNVGIGWGYNFDWQARAFYVPLGTPNLVTSVYVGRALLAYYESFQDEAALEDAKQVGEFILAEMVKFETDEMLCFNYIPGKDAEVHNANLLGAAYLAQINCYLDRPDITDKVLKSVAFSIADIREDGAWPYGTKPFHRWVDNFHTAYNIESLCLISRALGPVPQWEAVKARVIDYYFEALFMAEGTPKYFDNNVWPLDIHVIAEAIVLLNVLRQSFEEMNAERALQIEARLKEIVALFQDEQGFFYHQQTRRGWNKIPYIRWGQAWMFYALSACL
jgi:hypothetical protein